MQIPGSVHLICRFLFDFLLLFTTAQLSMHTVWFWGLFLLIIEFALRICQLMEKTISNCNPGTSWDKQLINQPSDVPSIIYFLIIWKNLWKNWLNLFSYFFTKIKIKTFECPKSIRNFEKNNAWNIRHLVNELFVPLTQHASVLFWRLFCWI